MLSFPHFYLGDENFLSAVEGISPPDKEKHKFFIDVHPVSEKFYFIAYIPNYCNATQL